MFLFVFLLCCVLQPLLHYYYVFGKRESLQRFVVEEGAKPAIFGSYSYDPVRQVFVPPPPDSNHKGTSEHDPPESQKTTSGQLDPNSDTYTTSESQTGTQTDPQSHQLITIPANASAQGQSLKDSFISTAGDTGTDPTPKDETILRSHVPASIKNLTLNFI